MTGVLGVFLFGISMATTAILTAWNVCITIIGHETDKPVDRAMFRAVLWCFWAMFLSSILLIAISAIVFSK